MAKYREFIRPRVDLDPTNRSWGTRNPSYLKSGDIVPGLGEVEDVSESATVSGEAHVSFVSGKIVYLNEPLFCFSEGEVVGDS